VVFSYVTNKFGGDAGRKMFWNAAVEETSLVLPYFILVNNGTA
jgi:hypothetical protein